MAFEVAAGVVAAAIVLRLEIEHDLRSRRLGAGVMTIDIGDDHISPLRVDARGGRRWLDEPYSVSASPSMIMPLPRVSSACVIEPPSPGTTIFRSKTNALHSRSMAAAPFR
jgi:hypothetical protein